MEIFQKTLNFGGKEKFENKVIISEAHKDKVCKIIILKNDIIYFLFKQCLNKNKGKTINKIYQSISSVCDCLPRCLLILEDKNILVIR